MVGYEHALNKSKIDPKIADLSLSELLMGFFDFYAQFEFSRINSYNDKRQENDKQTCIQISPCYQFLS